LVSFDDIAGDFLSLESQNTLEYLEILCDVDVTFQIQQDAFENCVKLKTVILPEGLTYLRSWAFALCTSLEQINLPVTLRRIERGTFIGCTSLTNITLPEGIVTIEQNTFNGCTSLENVTLPEGLTTIGYGAFRGCTSLKNITIPMSVISMGQKVFYECPNVRIKVAVALGLEHFTIPYLWSRIRDLFPDIPEKEQEQILLNTVDTLQARSFVKLNKYDKAKVEELLWETDNWNVLRRQLEKKR
jgi:hypothetical protein